MPAGSPRTENARGGSAGFTLLELMVVITISGILTALLLPALSSAKEKSRRCVCKANLEELITALNLYANDNQNGDFMPSAADNSGNYHAIILSDFAFTSLASAKYLGSTNCFYCPNLAYATGQMGGYKPNQGYTIGYSYLATNGLSASLKGPFNSVTPQRITDTLGPIFADANYWTGAMTIAPHGSTGSTILASVSVAAPVAPAATNSAAAGAVGGNEGYVDGHVDWKSIQSMKTYPASNDGSAFGSW